MSRLILISRLNIFQKRYYACRSFSSEEEMAMVLKEKDELTAKIKQYELLLCKSGSLLSRIQQNPSLNDEIKRDMAEQLGYHKQHRLEDFKAEQQELTSKRRELELEIRDESKKLNDSVTRKDKLWKELETVNQKLRKMSFVDMNSPEFLNRAKLFDE